MAQIQKQPRPTGGGDPAPAPAPAAQTQPQDTKLDDLLADIDDVLEVNAESFVRGFVQKGGE